METYRQIVIVFVIALLLPGSSFAYSINAHQALTDATIKAYESWRGDSFDDPAAAAIKKGSADEDEGKRPLNHFFDPVNHRGLTEFWRELGLQSEQWAQDTEAQANFCSFICLTATIGRNDSYFSSPTDYSWDRAVYEYAHGDKTRGLATLGHILHLIQDSTVPAHVRNDQHLSGLDSDPYEQYTASAAVPNVSSITVPRHSNLSAYFDDVAGYTNTRFVSKDTLFTGYDLPNLSQLDVHDGFAFDRQDGHKVAVVRDAIDRFGHKVDKSVILFDDINHQTVANNFSFLSRNAIQNGVGVIDLFFRSVEVEKKTLALEKKNTSAAQRDAKALATAGFGAVKKLYGSSLAQADIEDLNSQQTASAATALAEEPPVTITLAEEQPVVVQLSPEATQLSSQTNDVPLGARNDTSGLAGVVGTEVPANVTAPTPVSFTPQQFISPALVPREANPYQPGYGGGGGCSGACGAAAPTSDPAPVPVPVVPPPIVVPVAPVLSLSSPDDASVFATTTVTFTGSSTPSAIVSASGDASGSATTDSHGDWSLTLTLATGTSTISFTATKDAVDSATISRSIGVVLPPSSAPVVSATACAYSLSTSYCILPATSATVTWTNPGAAANFDVYVDGAFARTIVATSTSIALDQGATTTIEIVGHSASGDVATSTSLAIVSLSSPLRINEIAWAGTVQSPNDQWIELRNASGYALDLSHVAMVRSAGSELQLSGTAVGQDSLGNGYFLIERSEETTDVHADLVTPFDLFSQTGERVSLVWYDGTATTTLDATPVVAACHGWCAGHTAHAVGTSAQPGIPNSWAMESMERIGTDGSQASSWQSNDTYTATAHDSSGYIIYGTPRAANSAGWPAKGLYCGAAVLTESSPIPTFPASQFCVLLSRFISPFANRYVGFFLGDVGSSTEIAADLQGKVPTTDISLNMPGMNPGDHAFVVVWENRTNIDSDVANFIAYLTGAQPTPPHSNYAVFPWIMQ